MVESHQRSGLSVTWQQDGRGNLRDLGIGHLEQQGFQDHSVPDHWVLEVWAPHPGDLPVGWNFAELRRREWQGSPGGHLGYV